MKSQEKAELQISQKYSSPEMTGIAKPTTGLYFYRHKHLLLREVEKEVGRHRNKETTCLPLVVTVAIRLMIQSNFFEWTWASCSFERPPFIGSVISSDQPGECITVVIIDQPIGRQLLSHASHYGEDYTGACDNKFEKKNVQSPDLKLGYHYSIFWERTCRVNWEASH